jgi:hypothetical protein
MVTLLSAPTRSWIRRVCPDCRSGLTGGPVRYYCRVCPRDMSAYDVATTPAAAAPDPAAAVSFWGEFWDEVRCGLPGALLRAAIAAAAFVVGTLIMQLVMTVCSALGVLS